MVLSAPQGMRYTASHMHIKRLESRIMKAVHRAMRDFSLIAPGDKILVAVSGGKDSYGLLWALQRVKAEMPFEVNLVAFHLDQGQPGHDTAPIKQHLESVDVAHEIFYEDTYERVVEKTEPGKIYCSLCSRFRRAILYKAAVRHGCNKVALGHHRDDLIETLLMSVFHSGQIKSMPARLLSDTKTHEIIRPLCYVPEEELTELAQHMEFPIVPCNLCGSLEAQRKATKALLAQLSETYPHIKGNILRAMSNVRETHLLDTRLNPLHDEDPTFEPEPEDEPMEPLVQLGASNKILAH